MAILLTHLAQVVHTPDHVAKHLLLFRCKLRNQAHHATGFEVWHTERFAQLMVLIHNSAPRK